MPDLRIPKPVRVPAPIRTLYAYAGRHYRLVAVGGLLIVSLGYTGYTLQYPLGTWGRPQAGFFPLIVGVAMTVIVLGTLLRGAPVQADRALAMDEDEDEPGPGAGDGEDAAGGTRVLLFTLILIGYVVLLDAVGHFVASVLMLLAALLLARARPFWQQVVFAVGLTAASYVVFVVLLNVPLPAGLGL